MRNINKPLKVDQRHSKEDWFSRQLLEWYHIHKRDLPWRETKDPFKVWLSEIILQQTRVSQGLPYYVKFTEAFNTIEEFAHADLDEILKLWQGLGYYSRARNMHKCAEMVVADYSGRFPDNFQELQKLKGVGKYTAAAIASICFDQAVPTIDGNVFRVMSRLFGISDDIAKASSFKVFFNSALRLISQKEPGNFNQAMMEFGATICVPKAPDCGECMFSSQCFAKRKDMIEVLPIKSKNIKIKYRYFNYHVFAFKNQLLIRQRSSGDIWTGLFEFDLQETEKSLKSSNFENAKLQYSSEEIVHQLTHQKLHIQFHVYELDNRKVFEQLGKDKMMKIVSVNDLSDYAVPKPIELFLNKEFCQ
ncbi:A/G-specific DNA-adenine glycosylase [Reichenbachiella faecimaris]|uniref:Adenine DNA glycosylase n=1 Tax=Reichenbachiella faecimaris TaxID=692418 RepID=A0A1W2GER1_REIFA|nr:A/G-specific adenine glycosylase [Reichenbachiella faecimaris]SMD35160.1 A/G-specific DNA-adenine glycosylase [Reichenbachiella faecimaris]